MYCTRILKTLILALTAFLLSCTEGVESGSLLKDFSGISDIQVLSPTAVKITWSKHSRYKSYSVYSSHKSEAVLPNVQFDEAIIGDLEPNTTYTFKVVGTDGVRTVGGNNERTVTTLRRFQGIELAAKDAEGNIIIQWNYPHEVESFLVYYDKQKDPTSESTNSWRDNQLSTKDSRIVVRNLDGSTRYHFMVHVKYLDGSFEQPLAVRTVSTNSGFPTPSYELSRISIGSLPFAKVTPVVNSQYLERNYTSRMYLNGNPISDPLKGTGILVFSSTANLPLGKVTGLELRVQYTSANVDEILVIDGLQTYIKGIPTTLEKLPLTSIGEGVSYVGETMTTGDFNCDGSPDLAIGLPNAAMAELGIKERTAGAVYVYYSYTAPGGVPELKTTPNPVRNPIKGDPQVITFEDLTWGANFGASLSGGGNLNGDKLGTNECQDLVVGAPYLRVYPGGTGTRSGGTFVFFGSADGLGAPTTIADMETNYGTCSGEVEGASCTAVLLWPNQNEIPVTTFDPDRSDRSRGTETQFGYSVSHIGDFNGDGYGDIAIGAPRASFDGIVSENSSGDGQYELYTGAAYIYFGSANGIAHETLSSGRHKYLKVFAPVPQANARFGHSIAGGVDVDGGYRVQNGSKYYGGSDMVIGAPGFNYPNYGTAATNRVKELFRTGATCLIADDCASYIPTTEGYRGSIAPPANPATRVITNGWLPINVSSDTTLGTAPGAAYLYFGRRANSSGIGDPKETFWQCGRRRVTQPAQHFSCLAGGSAGVTLTPRFGWGTNLASTYNTQGFGTSVAMIGAASRTTNNTDPSVWVDSNRDGYGDVVVGAGYFDYVDGVANRNDAGALWVFYGNPNRLYEPKSFYDNSTGNRDNDWYFNTARCTTFATGSSAEMDNCSPVLLSPNSVTSGTLLGAENNIAIGDITGDGIHDVVVGGTGANNSRGSNSGVVFGFASSQSLGLTTTLYEFYNRNGNTGDRFGSSVAVGNFNNDTAIGVPLNDVFVGARLDDSTKLGGGAAYGFYSAGAALPAVNSLPSVKISDSIASPQTLGYGTFRIVGDVNGDGYDDAVGKISRPSPDSTISTTDGIVYFGSPIGLITTSFCLENKSRVFKSGQGSDSNCYPSSNPALGVTEEGIALPQLIVKPTGLSLQWAQHTYDVGDINNDGFDDVGFLDWNSDGQLVIYYGSRGGLLIINNPTWSPATGDPQIVTRSWARMESNTDNDLLDEMHTMYRSLVVHGDFNGDGFSDIVLANPLAPSFWKMNVVGGMTGAEYQQDPTGAVSAPNSGWYCGASSSDPACTSGENGSNMGRVIVFYGSSRGVQSPHLNGASSEPSVQANLISTNTNYLVDMYTSENVVSNRACNTTTQICKSQYVYSPLIVNVNAGFDRMRHFFGASMTVMDADGDGIDDLIVGAPGWEDVSCYVDLNSNQNYGRVFIYKGNAEGLLAHNRQNHYTQTYANGSCSSPEGPTDTGSLNIGGGSFVRALMPPLPAGSLTNNNSNRRFGSSVSVAGDLNNDGHEDLVVAAPFQTPIDASFASAGVMYVYYGPLCGSDNHVSVWQSQLTEFNTQRQFSDVIIGVNPIQECTRSIGSAKPAPMPFYIRDSQIQEYAGLTLTGNRKAKGDFNGDGFGDILIGSPYYDDTVNLINNVGRGVVMFGSSGGLNASDYPDSSVVSDANGKVKPYVVYQGTDQRDIRYFFSGTSAGDINGDGTMDFMVPSQFHDGYSPLKGVDVGTFYLFY